MEARQRFDEIFHIEIGPHPLGKMQLRVGAFPKKEVGQTFLAARPDDKINIS